jgi:hypothetical protein
VRAAFDQPPARGDKFSRVGLRRQGARISARTPRRR